MDPESSALLPCSSRRQCRRRGGVFMMTLCDKVFEQLLCGSCLFKAVLNNAANPKILLKHQISLCDSPR